MKKRKIQSKVKIVTDIRDLPLGAQRVASFLNDDRDSANLRLAVRDGKIRGWKFQLPGDAECRGTLYVMPDEALEFLRQFHARNNGEQPTIAVAQTSVSSTDAKLEQIANCLLRIEDMLAELITRPHQKPEEDPQQTEIQFAS